MIFVSNGIRLYGEADNQAVFWTEATDLQSGITVYSDKIGGELHQKPLLDKLSRALALEPLCE